MHLEIIIQMQERRWALHRACLATFAPMAGGLDGVRHISLNGWSADSSSAHYFFVTSCNSPKLLAPQFPLL